MITSLLMTLRVFAASREPNLFLFLTRSREAAKDNGAGIKALAPFRGRGLGEGGRAMRSERGFGGRRASGGLPPLPATLGGAVPLPLKGVREA